MECRCFGLIFSLTTQRIGITGAKAVSHDQAGGAPIAGFDQELRDGKADKIAKKDLGNLASNHIVLRIEGPPVRSPVLG
jgi:hypothetical protein